MHPLLARGVTRLIGTAVGASFLSSAAWLMLARGWNRLLARFWGLNAPFGEIAAVLFGFGLLLYMLSIAVSYIIAAFEHARDAERRQVQAQVQ